MRKSVKLLVLASCLGLTAPSVAFAAGEVTAVIGGLAGGDLDNILAGNVSIKGSFENGPLYGVRVGWIQRFFGVEGSFVASPSGVSITVPGQPIGVNGRVYYLEGNVLLIPIPGPISPFFTVGAGLHSYNLELAAAGISTATADFQKTGFNFGAGLKINTGPITFRGEVRDHITTIGPADLGLQSSAFGVTGDQKVHNLEISGGIGVRF